jgi:PAS domain S-box-containing protein
LPVDAHRIEFLVDATCLALLVALLGWLAHRGRAGRAFGRAGWSRIVMGCLLIVLASAVNLAFTVFEVLGDQDVVDDALASLVEGGSLLAGFALVAFGLVRWIPTAGEMRAEVEERRRTEADLRQKVAALESVPDGIGLLDGSGRFTYANPALRRLLGEPWPGALAGRPWTEPFPGAPLRAIAETLDREGSWMGTLSGRRADGGAFVAEARVRRLADGGHVAALVDTTEAVQRRDQLVQSQKLEAVGRVAGGFAHDFNNILAAMMGYATFLAEDLPEGTEHHRYARQIVVAGERARDLLQQILVFSQRQESARRPVDLARLVRESGVLLQATLSRTIELSVEADILDAVVEANPTQVNQVLVNLCLNAGDAIGREQGRVTVSLERLGPGDPRLHRFGEIAAAAPADAAPRLCEWGEGGILRLWSGRLDLPGPHLALAVADTGAGMDEPVLARLFEPFFTTKRVGEGTGLGLAAVHGIVATLGGAILVETVPGAGTRFDVLLPVAGAAVRPGGVGAAPAASGRESVLVVDDEDQVGAMLALALERLGYEVASCVSAEEALEALGEDADAFDLVLTDQRMPGLLGTELAARIAEISPGLPVLVCSGFAAPAGLLPTNIQGILPKPVDFAELARAVRGALDGAHAGMRGRAGGLSRTDTQER